MRTVFFAGLVGCAGCAPEVEVSPMAGPGMEAERIAAPRDGEYVLALTELHVRNAPGPGARFGELADAIATTMFPEDGGFGDLPGWLGTGFRNEGRLVWWTMSVWEDEASMATFMVQDAHLQAMAEIADVAVEARSLHRAVSADELPLDWDAALAELAATTPILGP